MPVLGTELVFSKIDHQFYWLTNFSSLKVQFIFICKPKNRDDELYPLLKSETVWVIRICKHTALKHLCLDKSCKKYIKGHS